MNPAGEFPYALTMAARTAASESFFSRSSPRTLISAPRIAEFSSLRRPSATGIVIPLPAAALSRLKGGGASSHGCHQEAQAESGEGLSEPITQVACGAEELHRYPIPATHCGLFPQAGPPSSPVIIVGRETASQCPFRARGTQCLVQHLLSS